MATPMKDKLDGQGKQLGGKAKETTSEWLGDEATAAEGRQQQVEGKFQETKGKGKAALKKIADKL